MMLAPSELDDLVKLAVRRDQASFAKLLMLQYPRLLARGKRMLPTDVLAHTSAEDVRQLAACEAWLNVESLKTETMGGFCRWLDGVMLNCIRYTLRQHHAIKRGGIAEHDGAASLDTNKLLEFLGRNTKSPRSALVHEELVQLLEAAVASMESEKRLAIQYRYLEGRAHADIARLMGRSEIDVRKLCSRAIRVLRELLPLSSGERKRASRHAALVTLKTKGTR